MPELSAAQSEQPLVVTGIRARIRHPIYLAHFCEMLAWSFGTGMVVCFALVVVTIVTGAVMIRAEDEELEQRFGDPYRSYREAVPAVFPRMRRG
jgi:protein-S-isoprenylcysteine O-methyltransferase Ste14